MATPGRYFQAESGRAALGQTMEPESERAMADELTAALKGVAAGQAGAAAGAEAGAESQAGGDNGTNPASNTTTAIITNQFYQLEGGNKININYFRLKYPVLEKKGGFLVEIPFQYLDFDNPVDLQVGGLGDIKFQFSYNLFTNPCRKTTFLTINELYIPSADNVSLSAVPDSNEFVAQDIGSGKFVFGPGVGVVWAPRPDFIFAPLYFYEFDFAGDSARQEIRRGKWRIFMMKAWESGRYVLPELQIVTNYLNGDNDVYFAPEMGKSFKGATFYIKPGIGIDPGINNRQWGLEIGTRINY